MALASLRTDSLVGQSVTLAGPKAWTVSEVGAPALCLRRLPPAPCGCLRGPGVREGGTVSASITASEHDQVADTRTRSLEGARGALAPCSAVGTVLGGARSG